MGEVRLRRSISTSFSLSIAFHLLFFVLMTWFISTRQLDLTKAPRQLTWIEVDPLPKVAPKVKDDDSKRIVQTRLTKKSQTAAPDAHLGKQTQTVDRQTVNRERMTSLGQTQGPKTMAPPMTAQAQPNPTPAEQTQAEPLTKPLGGLGLPILPTEKKLAKQLQEKVDRSQAFDAGDGGIPQEYIKGMKEGEQTALNTREYMFFGYFQRIRERLDRAWNKSLKDKLTKLYYGGRRLAAEMDHTTRVLVTLDPKGEITRVQILEESGTRDLDDAAVKAFNMAGPFPNPPAGILDQQGKISIRWEFILRT